MNRSAIFLCIGMLIVATGCSRQQPSAQDPSASQPSSRTEAPVRTPADEGYRSAAAPANGAADDAARQPPPSGTQLSQAADEAQQAASDAMKSADGNRAQR